jgi:hypothetical protein
VELGFREMPGLRRTLVMSSLSSITGLSERDLEAALEAIKSPTPRAPAQEEPVEVRTERVYRPSLEEQGFAPPQARARRDAERGLLAILLAHPTLSTSRVKLDDGSSLPLTEAITPESFLDPESRQIFEPVHVWLEDAHAFTAEELLAELRGGSAKSLAVDLVMLGERRAPSENLAAEQLQVAIDSFERIRRAQVREFSRSGNASLVSPTTSGEPEALEARLEAIRNRGRDPTAFGRLPGSSGQRAAGPPG